MKLKAITGIMLLLAVAFFSLGLQSVSAPAIPVTPIGTTITVTSNETFVLAYKMEWDDPANPGYFTVTVYWDVPTNASHLNFTYIDFVCNFTDGTAVPEITWILDKTPGPGFLRYVLGHRQMTGVNKDGAFWLNVTMRAAGLVNGSYVPHAGGGQTITISRVRCMELTMASASGTCAIHVVLLPAVGGNIVPTNKLELLMPYIVVVSVILVTMTVAVRKRRLNYTKG